jgi:hypothetical protein
LPYDMVQCAVVQCSVSPVPWDILERKFILEFNLGTCFNVSFVIVPVSFIVHPLCVFPNYGSIDSTSFFVVLPKQNWSNYFGVKVKKCMQSSSRKRDAQDFLNGPQLMGIKK